MESLFQEYMERGMKTYLCGDSGFLSPKLYKACEVKGCSYTICLKQNFSLIALASDKDEDLYKASKEDQISYAVTYGEFMYQAGSWEYPRRVVFKIEKPYGHLTHMHTFIVTNMDMESYQIIKFCRTRGRMENFIKEGKTGFDFAAMSSHSKIVNANRMRIHMLAYITPTAVIKQINLLEASLDVKLFDRTHRGLTLTKAGKSLYQDTKYIIQYCRDSVIRAKNAMQEDKKVIRIGSSPMTPAQLLMRLWTKIQVYCPEMKFQIVPFENTPENAREILANLGKNIDVIGGIFDETMLDLRRCAGLELSREPFCCAVSIHHRLAAKDRLTVKELYGEPDADAPGMEQLCGQAPG